MVDENRPVEDGGALVEVVATRDEGEYILKSGDRYFMELPESGREVIPYSRVVKMITVPYFGWRKWPEGTSYPIAIWPPDSDADEDPDDDCGESGSFPEPSTGVAHNFDLKFVLIEAGAPFPGGRGDWGPLICPACRTVNWFALPLDLNIEHGCCQCKALLKP